MRNSLLQNDPIIKMLFKAITTDYIPPEEDPKDVSVEYMKAFLSNLGVSDYHIKKIITELYKDIKFLEALHRRIKNFHRADIDKKMAVFYLIRLQNQTAKTIAQKIMRDDNEENAELLYAKLQTIRKFQERCGSPELFSIISMALNLAYESREIKPWQMTYDKVVRSVKDNGNIINLSDYINGYKVH